ncbi:hypothetical protein VTK56DRAFT_8 [Thermocarpiscus australiensis]
MQAPGKICRGINLVEKLATGSIVSGCCSESLTQNAVWRYSHLFSSSPRQEWCRKELFNVKVATTVQGSNPHSKKDFPNLADPALVCVCLGPCGFRGIAAAALRQSDCGASNRNEGRFFLKMDYPTSSSPQPQPFVPSNHIPNALRFPAPLLSRRLRYN